MRAPEEGFGSVDGPLDAFEQNDHFLNAGCAYEQTDPFLNAGCASSSAPSLADYWTEHLASGEVRHGEVDDARGKGKPPQQELSSAPAQRSRPVLEMRQELEKEMLRGVASQIREAARVEAVCSRERATELIRRRRAEAKEVEARQRDILAKAITRGAERGTSLSSTASAPSLTPLRSESPHSSSNRSTASSERRQKPPTLTFERVRGVVESAYARPLLIHSHVRPKNHYEILGLDMGATPAELRAAYTRLMQAAAEEEHQQEGHRNEQFGGERVQAITTAYNVLHDPNQRRAYDEALTGKPSLPPRHPLADHLEAEWAERVEQRKQQAATVEKEYSRQLQESVSRGTAKASYVGWHKLKPVEGVKSVGDCMREKRVESDMVEREQRMKIEDSKYRASCWDRTTFSTLSSQQDDPFPPPKRSMAAELHDAVIAERIAEKKMESQLVDKKQRQLLKDVCSRAKPSIPRPRSAPSSRAIWDDLTAERKVHAAVESKAQWAHLKNIREKVAAKERSFP